jgi:hypothetical protein
VVGSRPIGSIFDEEVSMVDSKIIKVLDQDTHKWAIHNIADIHNADIFSIEGIENDPNIRYFRAVKDAFFNSENLGYGVSAEEIIQESILAALIPNYKLSVAIPEGIDTYSDFEVITERIKM